MESLKTFILKYVTGFSSLYLLQRYYSHVFEYMRQPLNWKPEGLLYVWIYTCSAYIALPDVTPGNASTNTWSCWSVRGVEKEAADRTADRWVFVPLLLFAAPVIYSLDPVS